MDLVLVGVGHHALRSASGRAARLGKLLPHDRLLRMQLVVQKLRRQLITVVNFHLNKTQTQVIATSLSAAVNGQSITISRTAGHQTSMPMVSVDSFARYDFLLDFYADLRSIYPQCFDAGGWAPGRASGLWKLSDDVLLWLSVCSKVQIVCIWSRWFLCIPKPPSPFASFKFKLQQQQQQVSSSSSILASISLGATQLK